MPHEDKEQEEEQKARTAYDLIRMRLERLQKNIVCHLCFLFPLHSAFTLSLPVLIFFLPFNHYLQYIEFENKRIMKNCRKNLCLYHNGGMVESHGRRRISSVMLLVHQPQPGVRNFIFFEIIENGKWIGIVCFFLDLAEN